jgi:hypothetical protein
MSSGGGGGGRKRGKLRTAFWYILFAEQNVVYTFLKYLFISITTSVLIIRFSFFFRPVRSLWNDELWVAVAVITSDLFGSQAQWNATHPQLSGLLYLNTVKLLGIIFGYGEHVLRFFSLLAFLGTLFLVWKILRKVFDVDAVFAWGAVAMTSILPVYIRYSNELKPYMGDTFFILFVVWAYHLFSVGKIKVFWLGIIYSLILLFSIPSSFFIAGVLIVEFICALKSKDKKRILTLLLSGLLVVLVFAAHYYFWLHNSTKWSTLISFWENNYFNMFPTNIEQILHNYKLIERLFMKSLFPFSVFLSCLMAFCGFLLVIFMKHKPSIAVGLSIVLWLIASHFEKYPIAFRLNLFVYALIIIYMFVCLDRSKLIFRVKSLSNHLIANIKGKHLALFFIVFSIWMGRDYIDYGGKGLYFRGNQANELIEYVQTNIKDDEFLYVVNGAVVNKKTVWYKNGINNNSIGETDKKNIIWGSRFWRKNDEFNEDIEFGKIISARKCYILFCQIKFGDYKDYLKKLSAFGDLKLVKNVYETRLYYFTAKSKN